MGELITRAVTMAVPEIKSEKARVGCNVCKDTFKTKRCLKRHHERFEKKGCEKLFGCKLKCGKAYRTEGQLGNHMDYCSAETYSCFICNKTFKDRNQLKYHHIRHANIKQHSCDVCDKSFNMPSDLRVHQRIHTGEKKFSCTDCSKQFSCSSNLISHKRSNHSERRRFLAQIAVSSFHVLATLYHIKEVTTRRE